MKKISIICIFVFLGFKLQAQQVFFENITSQSGLPSDHIYDIYKDTKGYIWCASDVGLIRFNGKSFHLFDNQSNLSKSGSSIKEDSTGRIWYQTFDGYFFYIENNTLKQLPSHESSGFRSYAIQKQSLYRVVDDGIECVNLKTLEQSLMLKKKDLVFCHILGDWLYYGNTTVYRYHLEKKITEKVITLANQFNSLAAFCGKKNLLITDKSNAKAPFIQINSKGEVVTGALTLPETLQNVHFVNDEIWCFTRNGIYRFDKELHLLKDAHFFAGKNVAGYATDANGYSWISSPNNGIYVLKDFQGLEFSLLNDEFSSISHKNGILYTGTNSGKIYEHQPNLNTRLYFDTGENNHILFLDFNSYPQWNFFTGNGFYANDLQKGARYRNYTSVKDIVRINDTLIGMAATGYAGIANLHSNFNEDAIPDNAIANLRAKSCAYDFKTQTLYVATNKGLYGIDQNRNHTMVTHHNTNIFAKKLLYHNDTLWGIGNNGKAFYKCNDAIMFLQNETVFKNMRSYKGSLYLSSANSLFVVKNNLPVKINSIGLNTSIIDFEIYNDYAFVLTRSKLIKLPLYHTVPFRELPTITITSVKFNDQVFSSEQMKNIPYTHNSLAINLDIINFDDLHGYDFFYEINGRAFRFEESSASIVLPELQSGSYHIALKIFDRISGTMVFATQIHEFTIVPPFWKQSWFLGLITLFALAGLYGLYRFQIRRITQRNMVKVTQLTLENHLKESRLQLIKSQMNPHFFFNAINNIQSYIFTNETKEASQYLFKFSKLTRKILEFSEVNSISLKEEIESLQLYLELQQMRFKDFQFTIEVQNIGNTEAIKIPTMLYQPYVENAILHGLSHSVKSKKLSIVFFLENMKTLVGIIKDNGVGRVKSAEINSLYANKPKSFATKANLERIQLLNKDVHKITVDYTDVVDEDGADNGTQVTIKIEL